MKFLRCASSLASAIGAPIFFALPETSGASPRMPSLRGLRAAIYYRGLVPEPGQRAKCGRRRCAGGFSGDAAEADAELEPDRAEPKRADNTAGVRTAQDTPPEKDDERMLRRTVGQVVLAPLSAEKATRRRSPAAPGQDGVSASETSHPPTAAADGAVRKALRHETLLHE